MPVNTLVTFEHMHVGQVSNASAVQSERLEWLFPVRDPVTGEMHPLVPLQVEPLRDPGNTCFLSFDTYEPVSTHWLLLASPVLTDRNSFSPLAFGRPMQRKQFYSIIRLDK